MTTTKSRSLRFRPSRTALERPRSFLRITRVTQSRASDWVTASIPSLLSSSISSSSRSRPAASRTACSRAIKWGMFSTSRKVGTMTLIDEPSEGSWACTMSRPQPIDFMGGMVKGAVSRPWPKSLSSHADLSHFTCRRGSPWYPAAEIFCQHFRKVKTPMNAVSSLDSVPESQTSQPSIAVLIPCLNEAAAIAKVVADFKAHLPTAWIFVYDNGSTDDTVKIARAAGAVVRIEPMRGKGNVVRRMFADVEADVFVLVDGDDTYDAGAAPELVDLLLKNTLDMATPLRQSTIEAAYRRGHVLGNRLLTGLVAAFFGNRISDLLSGYRVFSRRFVKSFPALTTGFEIETELSVHALQLRMPIGEVNTDYRERPAGSASKLSNYKDGFRILRTIAVFVKEVKPLAFFSVVSLVLVVIALALSVL